MAMSDKQYADVVRRLRDGDAKDTSPSSDPREGMIQDMKKSNAMLVQMVEMLRKQVAQLEAELAMRKAQG